jgi:hypothetical protein
MTEILSGSVVTLEEQIRHHLEYSISVPIPNKFLDVMTSVCVQAIKDINDYNLEAQIPFSMGIKWVELDTGIEHDYIPAYEAMRIYGLTDWLKPDWKMPKDKE